MDETGATATGAALPGSATGDPLGLSVEDAAEALGISPQAVRKRIARGTLPARRDGRGWRVVLDRAPGATGATATAQPRARPRPQPPHPAVSRQRAQLAAVVEPFTAPLVARIEALARDVGRLEAERDAAVERLAEIEVRFASAGAEVAERATAKDAPRTRPEPPGAFDPWGPTQETLMFRWRRWLRRMTGG
jgi:excisionase family DNA binding protein